MTMRLSLRSMLGGPWRKNRKFFSFFEKFVFFVRFLRILECGCF